MIIWWVCKWVIVVVVVVVVVVIIIIVVIVVVLSFILYSVAIESHVHSSSFFFTSKSFGVRFPIFECKGFV